MAFAWSVIDGIVHGPDLLLADGGEAGALGETLTNQPVGVPVAAAPPWMTGQGEAEHRAGGLYDLLEVGGLHTPVQGHGPALRMPSERADPHIGNVASGMRGAASSGEQTASAVHERDEARPAPLPTTASPSRPPSPERSPTISGRCPPRRAPGISPRRSSGPPLPRRRLPL